MFGAGGGSCDAIAPGDSGSRGGGEHAEGDTGVAQLMDTSKSPSLIDSNNNAVMPGNFTGAKESSKSEVGGTDGGKGGMFGFFANSVIICEYRAFPILHWLIGIIY